VQQCCSAPLKNALLLLLLLLLRLLLRRRRRRQTKPQPTHWHKQKFTNFTKVYQHLCVSQFKLLLRLHGECSFECTWTCGQRHARIKLLTTTPSPHGCDAARNNASAARRRAAALSVWLMLNAGCWWERLEALMNNN